MALRLAGQAHKLHPGWRGSAAKQKGDRYAAVDDEEGDSADDTFEQDESQPVHSSHE